MADTTRGRQLQKLAATLPGANQKVQKGLGEARKTQLQATIGAMAPQQATTQATQQLGAGMAQQAGQAQLQGAQQQQQQNVQLGQMALQGQAREQRAEGFEQKLALNDRQQAIGNKLARIDRQLKNELLDKQLAFNKTQAGQTLFNDRQLMDWAVLNAQSEEDFKSYQNEVTKQQQRKMAILSRVAQAAETALQRSFKEGETSLNQEHQKKLAQLAANARKAAQKAQNDASNKRAQWGAIGTIVGTGIGAVVGTMAGGNTIAGAAIGGKIGGALGSGAAGATG